MEGGLEMRERTLTLRGIPFFLKGELLTRGLFPALVLGGVVAVGSTVVAVGSTGSVKGRVDTGVGLERTLLLIKAAPLFSGGTASAGRFDGLLLLLIPVLPFS